MKSSSVVLLIVILMALTGGLTFVYQYIGSHPASPRLRPDDVPTPTVKLLRFSQSSDPWAVDVPEYVTELKTRQHHDWTIDNPTGAPVNVGLEYKSCTCADVSLALLTPEEAKHKAVPTAADRWQRLEVKGAAVAVPAATSESPAVGVVRLSWEGKKAGPERLRAQLWMEQTPHGRLPADSLQVSVTFVPPVLVEPAVVKVRDLTTGGQEETAEFTCWSATRATFPLSVQEEKPTGHVVCSWKPLTADQLRDLAKSQKLPAKTGYRVSVTVHERRDGVPLDLGPLERKLIVTGPADGPPTSVTVTGLVRGEVAVASADDAERINLRSFLTSAGTSKTVPLVAEDEKVQVRLDSFSPDYLEVRLEPREKTDGRRRWDLHVKVPPRAVIGPLPADGAVVLRLEGTTPRRLRLPVSGQGTQ